MLNTKWPRRVNLTESRANQLKRVNLLIVRGGTNGCGIARDAVGRRLSVILSEQHDLASATSSASTKLYHGGLRYLEYFKFGLVRNALAERQILLRAMPHISWPMRFILPINPAMHSSSLTPMSKLLNLLMPWQRGTRPAWLIRLGLFLYDHLGGRKLLPATSSVNLQVDLNDCSLKTHLTRVYEYSECWIDDAKLVLLHAMSARDLGAKIFTRTKVVNAIRHQRHWTVSLEDLRSGVKSQIECDCLINAAEPWVLEMINLSNQLQPAKLRLIRGSHSITRKLYGDDRCFFLQGPDGRIIFTIPYERDFTLIGPTDVEHSDGDYIPVCSPEEKIYLLNIVSNYFLENLTEDDIVHTYSGIRALYDDGPVEAAAAKRDYVLDFNIVDGAPVLNIFGGKITTFRLLAESALELISSHLRISCRTWTASVALPGGDFPVDGYERLIEELSERYYFIDPIILRRLARQYGTLT